MKSGGLPTGSQRANAGSNQSFPSIQSREISPHLSCKSKVHLWTSDSYEISKWESFMQVSWPDPLLYFGDQESGVADLICQITEDQTKRNGCCFHGEA